MNIFSSLNKEGTTIILVTHERDIAAFARRTIEMKDGYIYMDKINSEIAV